MNFFSGGLTGVLCLLANVLEELEGFFARIPACMSFFVVPRHVDANVSVACPNVLDLVMLLEDGHEVVNVFFTNVFYAEIVDNKGKENGPCGVFP